VASFLAIARLGSFRVAARELGISQGAISQRLQKLESLLGAPLIERDPRGCHLTLEGREFESHARNIQCLATNALNSFRDRRLAIGASSNIGIYLLHPYLKTYEDHAGANIDIHIHRNPVVAEKLCNGDIDVALMEWWDRRPGYASRVWRAEDMVVIVAPNHPWVRLPCVSRDQLRETPMLGGESGTGTGRVLAKYLDVELAALPVGVRLGSTDAVKQWVRAGMGVSLVLAGTVKDEIRAAKLIAIPLEGNPPPRKNLQVIWRDSLTEEHVAYRFGTWLAECAT
jgi:DNA-binding transcriptional LysR family regulator